MKTIPPPCPEPATGQKYWRSLDDLAEAPEFRQWVEREFPAGASEFTDPVGRRHFVKIMGASFLLGGLGLTGCRRPEEKILPFSRLPEGYTYGVAQYYATAMPTRTGAIPLVVKSNEGRPTKVEGNPQHPDSNGATDTFAQASILGLYDPDRAQRFAQAGNSATREAALDFLATLSRKFRGNGGAGLAILMEPGTSPSRDRLQQLLQQQLPQAKFYLHDPLGLDVGRRAASQVFGSAVSPYFRLEQASVIVSLDADFLGSEEDRHRLIRGYAKGRKSLKKEDPINRLYAIEGLMTLTGLNADHRLRVATSAVGAVAAALAAEVLKSAGAAAQPLVSALGNVTLPQGVTAAWIQECAKDLIANRGKVAVIAGHRQPIGVHILAFAINAALGSVGTTLQLNPVPSLASGNITDLAQALNAGNQVDTLVILNSNPAYTAPADLDWATTSRKAGVIVRLGYYEDESAAKADWHLPAAHYLESWGDALTSDGTYVPVQPLIEPLFGGLTEIEVLARLAGQSVVKPYDIVRDTFRQFPTGDGVAFENQWKKFLHDGFLGGSARGAVSAAFNFAGAASAVGNLAAPALSDQNLEVVFYRDYSVDDGRYNNNGWLQELPDPVTKLTWDNAALISRETAAKLGLVTGDVVEISAGGRKVTAGVMIQPGLANNSVALALGYGREKSGRVGGNGPANTVGFNAYPLRTSASPSLLAGGAKVTRTGKTWSFAVTQEHGSMEGRPIIREANLEDYRKAPNFARNFDLDSPHHSAHIPKEEGTDGELAKRLYKTAYDEYEDERKKLGGAKPKGPMIKSDVHQWGMSVDLTSCVGCATCVVACQSENNIPIVGKDQVQRNREMHWLRIDRYFSGSMEKQKKEGKDSLIDDPQGVIQPMFCLHCENAPCESVCPVNATVHDEEGLNVMAYNRCVGTRYCSNNCPYKVRRFNFFDYNKRPLDKLKGPYYSSPAISSTDGEWDVIRWFKNPDKGYRPEQEWELLKLGKNPNVSVRMRGVMEKCTYCVQRIEEAKIGQKVKARASGDIQVPDGAFKTACEQACPAEAIVFGNLLDPNSRVSQIKKHERDYSVLGFLDTRPRTTYLARLRNPNPAMPDFKKIPLSVDEYMGTGNANPYEEHHSGAEHGHGEAGHGAQPAGAAGEKKGAH